MMKVLAAEMSDPQRLRRGKQYAKDGSVLDIVVDAGVVTCEVQGTRSTPYIAALEVTPGDGMPLRRDVHAVCNCPDDANWDDHACKHVIATMFAFADELLQRRPTQNKEDLGFSPMATFGLPEFSPDIFNGLFDDPGIIHESTTLMLSTICFSILISISSVQSRAGSGGWILNSK